MAKKNGKQLKIAGTSRDEGTIHKDVEKAATKYVAVRDERMELTKEEVKLQAALVAAMDAHNLETYICDDEDLEVIIKGSARKAKVKRRGEDEEEEAAA